VKRFCINPLGQKHVGSALMAFVLLLSAAPVFPVQAGEAQWERYGNRNGNRDYESARNLIDRTQQDLRESAGWQGKRNDPHNRYEDAQGHLSTVDRKLTRGKFDNGELKKSIGKIREILDKNVLQGSSRDALRRDLEGLERLASRSRY
jgi:hypothetical protein